MASRFFFKMTAAEQAAHLRAALPEVLDALEGDCIATRELVALLDANRTVIPKTTTAPKCKELVNKRLMEIAEEGYPRATKDGEPRKFYGREVRGWRWWRDAPDSLEQKAKRREAAEHRRAAALAALRTAEADLAALDAAPAPSLSYDDIL